MGWRDERRKDQDAAAARNLTAQLAMREQERADRAVQAEQARKDRAEKAARWQARRAAVAGWVRAHAMHLLFLPIILIPAVLAWPAMAVYGREIFGAWGVLLPGFTEGSMWAFAFAVTMARAAGRPVGWLVVGVWVCCAVAGGLNFAHGYTQPGGGISDGVVMAAVSVGGVVVHQLITARPRGPLPTRAERYAAWLARLAERRTVAVRAAAVRHAVADVSGDGTARLVFQPGLVRLGRTWWGRARLVPVIVPGLPPGPLPGIDPATETLVDEITAYLADTAASQSRNRPGTGQTPSGTDQVVLPPDVPERVARRVPALLARVREGIQAGVLPARPTRTEVQRFLKVRAQVAIVVTYALYGGGDGNSPAGAVS
ncbi:hypothetical protein KIPE111705_36920 [Kibdelosporangium persicum]|uniref:Uncharacterized protein n=1 Tax=Kibdelosporangium persicum TaxID=2698649 RepID=A0ABX2F3T5_9PSEU|nr:hypothetical protein [Kibdelosporangium persicum]NRN65902.1 hypothetical protein [Kibdelosporangium persicum]